MVNNVFRSDMKVQEWLPAGWWMVKW